MKFERFPKMQGGEAQKMERARRIGESIDAWAYAQDAAKQVYGQLEKYSNSPQAKYQELQTNLEAHQKSALQSFDFLAKNRAEALAAIGERRKTIGSSYEKDLRRSAQIETEAGQKIFHGKLDRLDELEQKLRSLGG